MKRSLSILIAAILVSAPVIAANAAPEVRMHAIDSLDVQFATPLTEDEVTSLVERTGVQPVALQYELGPHTYGYVLGDGETLPIALQNFRTQHAEFLLNITSSMRNAMDADETLRAETDAEALLQSFEQLVAAPRSVRLSGIRIRGDDDAARLLREPEVQSIAPSRRSQDTEVRSESLRGGRIESLARKRWAPAGGQAEVGRGFATQTFYFANLKDFDAKSTYEAETQIYDPKFANYAGYWSSNLPRAYLDTPFGDSPSLDNFTIGSAQASAIGKNRAYYVYMSLKPQTAKTAQVYIKGQLGHRKPAQCFLTWCVWPDSTQSLTSFTAPGSGRWK